MTRIVGMNKRGLVVGLCHSNIYHPVACPVWDSVSGGLGVAEKHFQCQFWQQMSHVGVSLSL